MRRVALAGVLAAVVVTQPGCLIRVDADAACTVARDLRSGVALLDHAMTAVDEGRVDEVIALGNAARELGASVHDLLSSLREDGMREDHVTMIASAALVLDQMGFFFAQGPDASNSSLDAAQQARDEADHIATEVPRLLRAEYGVDCG